MKNKNLNYLILILAGLLLYGVTVFFGFSYFDDQTLILENKEIISNFSNLGEIFTEDVFFSNSNFYYRPLMTLSLMLDAQISGISPWFYHLSNIVYHILVVLLIYSILRKLKVPLKRSFFLSFLFLIHPALVQAVAWIPGRNDSLLAIFILSSFLFFLKFLENSKVSSYAASLIFFLLALFTKESAIFFPILIIFYYLFLNSRKLQIGEKALYALGGSLMIFFWYIMRSLAIDGDIGTFKSLILSIIENSPVLIIALGKFFFPFNLGIMPVLRDVTIVYGLISILIISLLAYTKKINKHWLVFGLLWFIIFMLPSFVNPNPNEFYYLLLLEHRLYLPFIGLIFIFTDFSLSSYLQANKSYINSFLIKNAEKIFITLIISCFLGLSINHLPNFKDRLSFWTYAATKAPNSPLAHRNLGVMLYFDDRLDEAEVAYRRSLELNPQEPMVHNNLGIIYQQRGEYDLAEKEFLLELELKSSGSYYLAKDNLDNLLILKKKLR